MVESIKLYQLFNYLTRIICARSYLNDQYRSQKFFKGELLRDYCDLSRKIRRDFSATL